MLSFFNRRTWGTADPTLFDVPGDKAVSVIGFGDIHGPKPYKFIGFGAMDVTKPYK